MSDQTLNYQPKTEQELEQLAQDWVAGRIFTSLDIDLTRESVDMVRAIFMPFAFLSAESMLKLKEQNVVFFYEYMDKAGSRSVNGYPIFVSMKYLSEDDGKAVITKAREISEFLQSRKTQAAPG